jgi:hypothetical protein
MTKLPVADTIRFAYTFAFGQIGAIIGLVWLPLVIVAFLQFLPYALGTAYTAAGSNSAEATGATFIDLAFSTTALVLYAMNFVSVTRQALGLRQGAASIHIALGWPEWRMFAAIVISGLILTAALGLYLILGSMLFPGAPGGGLMAGLVVLYAVAGFGAFVWFALRLVFLLAPVVVVEERLDLVRAFLLSRGNVWRILAITLAVTLPLLLVQGIALGVIVGPELFAPLSGTSTAIAERFRLLDRHMPALIGLFLMLTPFNLGLVFGASSFAYRTLVPPRTAPRV